MTTEVIKAKIGQIATEGLNVSRRDLVVLIRDELIAEAQETVSNTWKAQRLAEKELKKAETRLTAALERAGKVKSIRELVKELLELSGLWKKVNVQQITVSRWDDGHYCSQHTYVDDNDFVFSVSATLIPKKLGSSKEGVDDATLRALTAYLAERVNRGSTTNSTVVRFPIAMTQVPEDAYKAHSDLQQCLRTLQENTKASADAVESQSELTKHTRTMLSTLIREELSATKEGAAMLVRVDEMKRAMRNKTRRLKRVSK